MGYILLIALVFLSVFLVLWFVLTCISKIAKAPATKLSEKIYNVVKNTSKHLISVRSFICRILHIKDEESGWSMLVLICAIILALLNAYILFGNDLETAIGIPYIFGVRHSWYYVRTYSLPFSLLILMVVSLLWLEYSKVDENKSEESPQPDESDTLEVVMEKSETTEEESTSVRK